LTQVQAGQAYTFTPSAADADADKLSFSIQNKPSWAIFNTSTGALSGTPLGANAGTYANIVISVSDGKASTPLPGFTITVKAAPANGPPSIGGSPVTTVVAGTAYIFTPTASDPDGNTLTFTIQNKPSWASFSTSTGTLGGTPSSADTGTYSNIAIAVSDGTTAKSLPAFNINVTSAPTSGTALVKWSAPTTNTNGTSLTNLAGYVVQYGDSPTVLAQRADVQDPTATSYTVTGLGSGTWYFAVSSYSTDGSQSAPSTVVSKTIQ
jgi:hypothetical protein